MSTRSTASLRAIAIRQKNTTRNPRSTVATSTEFTIFCGCCARASGRTYCPNCGTRVQRDTVDQVADAMLTEPAGSRWYVAVPGAREHAHRHAGAARPPVRAAQEGLQSPVSGRPHVRVFDAGIAAGYRFRASRCLCWSTASRSAPDLHQRLVDTVEICYREAGEVHFRTGRRRGGQRAALQREVRSARRAVWSSCEPEPACSASTSPFGACPRCQGFGNTIDYDMDLVIPDTDAVARRGRRRSLDQAEVPVVAGELLKAVRKGKVRFERAVLRPEGGRAGASSYELQSASSSTTSRRRSTSCTCASS